MPGHAGSERRRLAVLWASVGAVVVLVLVLLAWCSRDDAPGTGGGAPGVAASDRPGPSPLAPGEEVPGGEVPSGGVPSGEAPSGEVSSAVPGGADNSGEVDGSVGAGNPGSMSATARTGEPTSTARPTGAGQPGAGQPGAGQPGAGQAGTPRPARSTIVSEGGPATGGGGMADSNRPAVFLGLGAVLLAGALVVAVTAVRPRRAKA